MKICKCGCGKEFNSKYNFQLFFDRKHCDDYYSSLRFRKKPSIKKICNFCRSEFLTSKNKKFCNKKCKILFFKHSYSKEKWKQWREKYKDKKRLLINPEIKNRPLFTSIFRKGLVNRKGYLYVFMPNHPMSGRNGYYLLHRHKYEKYLGRHLSRDEIIHHIDGNISNNDIKNLERVESNSKHILLHYASRIIDYKGRFSRCAEVMFPS